MMCRITTFAAVAFVLIAGCGGAPKPTEQLTTARATTQAARELGADQDPQAKLHLQLADQQVDRANQLIAKGENEKATWMLQRATSDAELALAITRKSAASRGLQQSTGMESMPGTETMP